MFFMVLESGFRESRDHEKPIKGTVKKTIVLAFD